MYVYFWGRDKVCERTVHERPKEYVKFRVDVADESYLETMAKIDEFDIELQGKLLAKVTA